MTQSMVIADPSVDYVAKEGVVVAVALAWVLMLGSSSIAAIILCGWRGSKSVSLDWKSMKATFVCR
ncbi:hypothetical protein KDA11_04500 [Candidatus Saccharibacteria bacterium]|nr:hypothetical protein [Candidatus Saccharibacteria bacterium]